MVGVLGIGEQEFGLFSDFGFELDDLVLMFWWCCGKLKNVELVFDSLVFEIGVFGDQVIEIIDYMIYENFDIELLEELICVEEVVKCFIGEVDGVIGICEDGVIVFFGFGGVNECGVVGQFDGQVVVLVQCLSVFWCVYCLLGVFIFLVGIFLKVKIFVNEEVIVVIISVLSQFQVDV